MNIKFENADFMDESFRIGKIARIHQLYDQMQKRFAMHYAEFNPSSWNRIISKGKNVKVLPHWLKAKEQVLNAVQQNNIIELASLLNLHALNSAIEATRYNDHVLAGLAEEMRLLAEEFRRGAI